MHITVDGTKFHFACAYVAKAVQRKTPVLILARLALKAENGVLTISGTDLEVWASVSIECETHLAGAVLIPAFDLVKSAQNWKTDIVAIEVKDDFAVIVKHSMGESRFVGQNFVNFPRLTFNDFDHKLSISATNLTTAFNQVAYAISNESARYYLNGILLHSTTKLGERVLRAVACDGHRLAICDMSGAVDYPLPDWQSIIPTSAVKLVLAAIKKRDQNISIYLNDRFVKFDCGDVVIVAKHIDGTYPEYERVMPTKFDKKMIVSASNFLYATKTIAQKATQKTVLIAQMEMNNNVLQFVTNTDCFTVACDYSDQESVIAFNAKYLFDVAQILSGDVKFEIPKPSASFPPPVRITDMNNNTVHILMQVRT